MELEVSYCLPVLDIKFRQYFSQSEVDIHEALEAAPTGAALT
jgi:hypothetical protein